MAFENRPGLSTGKSRRKSRPEFLYEIDLPDFWDGALSTKPFLHYFQSLFLDAVKRNAPFVLESLRKEVWERTNPTLRRDELLRRWGEEKLSKEFHLPPWVLYYAEVAMSLWSTHSGWEQVFGWPSISRGWSWSGDLPYDESAIPAPNSRWEVCREPWSAFEKKAKAEFQEILKSYRKRACAPKRLPKDTAEAGSRRTPRSRGLRLSGVLASPWLDSREDCSGIGCRTRKRSRNDADSLGGCGHRPSTEGTFQTWAPPRRRLDVRIGLCKRQSPLLWPISSALLIKMSHDGLTRALNIIGIPAPATSRYPSRRLTVPDSRKVLQAVRRTDP